MVYTTADWSIDRSTKNIRYIGGDHDNSPSYATVIQAHRAWQALADDAVSTGDDELDISQINPSARSTDNIVTLVNGYNLDKKASEHLYDGSIIQDGGDTIYDGFVNFGNASVQIQLLQDGRIIADDFWNQSGVGINADATSGISHRFMIKVRLNGVDIDQRRIIGVNKTFGNTFKEFKINATARGNNVLALDDKADLNNDTAIGTVAGYTGVTNTEGLRLIDVDNNTVDEEYYSEWNTNQPTRSIKEFYERTKWLSKDPVTEDSNTDSGSLFVVDDATITGAAQSFANDVNAVSVSKVTVNIRKNGSPTGAMTCAIYTHSGTFGTSSTPNVIVGAVSESMETSDLTTTYETTTFYWESPPALTASTNYVLVIEHANGAVADYVEIEGLGTSGTHAGNRSHNTAGWTAVAADDLAFEVFTAPLLNGMLGNEFRGINYSMGYDTELGGIVLSTNDELVWGTALVYSSLTGTPVVGEAVHEDTATPVWKARILAVDLTNLTLIVDVESGAITSAETFTCQTSGATATVNGTPTVVSGGGVFWVLADDSTDNIIYVQITKGTIGLDNAILYYAGAGLDSADTTDTMQIDNAGAAITERTIETPFVGTSTGTTIIGSYGLGIEAADLTSLDKVFDLTNTQITPPNNVTNTFAGLVSGEDRAFVAPWNGTTTDVNGDPAVDKGQMLISTALTADNITSVVVKTGTETAIPTDTPSTGYIRVIDDNGLERRLHYSSWSGTTFTVDTTDGNEDFAAVNASVDNQIYIVYIDELASGTTATFTGVRASGTRNLVALDRDGGATPIKQFISSWTFTSSNQTLTAIRTSDS